MAGYHIERRYHILALKELRDLGVSAYCEAIRFHQGNLSYLRHQRYSA